MSIYRPTASLRLLELPLSGEIGLIHPTATIPYEGARIVRVLQQLWVSEAGAEWRDIPIQNECEKVNECQSLDTMGG